MDRVIVQVAIIAAIAAGAYLLYEEVGPNGPPPPPPSGGGGTPPSRFRNMTVCWAESDPSNCPATTYSGSNQPILATTNRLVACAVAAGYSNLTGPFSSCVETIPDPPSPPSPGVSAPSLARPAYSKPFYSFGSPYHQ